MKKISLLLPVVALVLFAFAPGKSGFEGKITYSITYEDLPEEYEAYASMLPKETVIYIKGDKTRTESNTGMGSQVMIMDKVKDEFVMLMDMMGMKTAYKGTMSEMKDKDKEEKMTFKYVEGTKEIAGYNCKKAEMTGEGFEEPVVVWYTEDLPSGTSKLNGLNGFPMEYYMANQGMVMKMTVTTISAEKVSDTYFTIPDGYEVKPYSDLKKMTGGK